ncbi:hypothetical protein ACSU1N_01410 [Thermogladius sp. 4427co]|uniref:hypothetical protein n=1 Tax=Thermogladius sp. 4427co TaxID=3450718 RepID=UPI003F798ADF
MSLSSTLRSGSIWSRLFWKLKPKDPTIKNLYDAIVILDKMINSIESSKKSLKLAVEEHTKRSRFAAQEGRSDIQVIFDEEMKHISNLIGIFEKISYDLLRVRYRLETLTLVEEPMKLMPEVIRELQDLRPELERYVPELTAMFNEVERKVASIMAVSNLEPLAMTVGSFRKTSGENKDEIKPSIQISLPPLPPQDELVSKKGKDDYSKNAQAVRIASLEKLDVPINVIAQWLLEEIRSKGGILDVQSFVSRYKVSKEKVYEALKSLEDKGVIKIKRY